MAEIKRAPRRSPGERPPEAGLRRRAEEGVMSVTLLEFFEDYFLNNYVMIFELVGLLILLEIGVHITDQISRMTLAVVILLFFESLFYHLDEWLKTLEYLHPYRPVLNGCMFTIYPLILLLVMQLTLSKKLTRRGIILLLIPEAVSIPFYFTTQWTHLICWFSETNVYYAGPVRFWPGLIFAFYSAVFLVHNAIYFKGYSRVSMFVTVYVLIGPLVGVLYYTFFRVESDYSALFTSAILLYFICIYIHRARIDPLTEAMNRQSYYRDMQTKDRSITAVVSMDMNELKYLNDHLGHEAGDAALTAVSGILRECCGRSGIVYRIGGDEFIIFYINASESAIAETLAAMREKLSRTPYSCAFGCAVREGGEPLKDVISRSDKAMYADKDAIKRALLERGGTVHNRE